MAAQLHEKGKPAHASEAEGIRFLAKHLPSKWHLYSNVEVAVGRRAASTYEHDVIAVAPHAVFCIELKSFSGRISGNRDYWQLESGRYVPSPIGLNSAKARCLKGLLTAHHSDLGKVWVQSVIFLHAPDADPDISADYGSVVFTQKTILKALTTPAAFGRRPNEIARAVPRICKVVDDGTTARQAERTIAQFDLEERIPVPGDDYTAWLARDRNLKQRKVLHVWDLPTDDREAREAIRRRALKSVALHGKVRGVADILQGGDYQQEADPPRIVEVFEDWSAFVRLSTWLEQHKDAPLASRGRLAARIARALAAVHEAGILHRKLGVDAVLVHPDADPDQLRLCAFDLGRDLSATASATVAASYWKTSGLRCLAPEVLRFGRNSEQSDLFSLGALLWELLSGAHLFSSGEQALGPYEPGPLLIGDQPAPEPLQALLHQLLARAPEDRNPAGLGDDPHGGRSARAVADTLADLFDVPRTRPADTGPRKLAPGELLRGTYELVSPLGEGTSGWTWLARHHRTGEALAIKVVAADGAQDVVREARVLQDVQHPALLQYRNLEKLDDGRQLLVTKLAEGVSADLYAGAGDPATAAQVRTLAAGLFGALGALHREGWLHRDVKPANLFVHEATLAPTLLDVGLAARLDDDFGPADLVVGSIPYKDPHLWDAGRWTTDCDVYAAAITLYEVLTGVHPFDRAAPEPDREPTVLADHLPDTLDDAQRAALEAFFVQALQPDPPQRHGGPDATRDALLAALGRSTDQTRLPTPVPVEAPGFPPDTHPDSPISVLRPLLSSRGNGALGRLGVALCGQLRLLGRQRLRALPNVGSKTSRELLEWAERARAAWPLPEGAPDDGPALDPGPVLFARLGGDDRPLRSLGRALTHNLRALLAEQGISTIGQLAVLPVQVLLGWDHVGPTRVDKLRDALEKLEGGDQPPADLARLDQALRADLKDREHEVLTGLLGLQDGVPVGQSELAEQLGISRQRVHQLGESALAHLRSDASHPGRWLRDAAAQVIGPVGFVGLSLLAQSLERRFPPVERRSEALLGWARLASLLLAEDRRASRLADLRAAVAPPWEHEALEALVRFTEQTADWPPVPRAELADRVWNQAPEAVTSSLLAAQQDQASLLAALLLLCGDTLRVAPDGAVYTPPVDLAPALTWLGPRVPTGRTPAEFLDAVERMLPGLVRPAADRLPAALEPSGLVIVHDRIVREDSVEATGRFAAPKLDRSVDRQQVSEVVDRRPAVVQQLAAAARVGGFRVVALDDRNHDVIACRLAGWLDEELGDSLVFRAIDIDACLLRALRNRGLWDDAVFYDRFVGGDAALPLDWAAADLEAELDALFDGVGPGTVTLLVRPALLGSLGLLHWVSGFYDRARGGRHGLVVLAMPGSVRQDRVWLNHTRPFPCAPDMAPVYLEPADLDRTPEARP